MTLCRTEEAYLIFSLHIFTLNILNPNSVRCRSNLVSCKFSASGNAMFVLLFWLHCSKVYCPIATHSPSNQSVSNDYRIYLKKIYWMKEFLNNFKMIMIIQQKVLNHQQALIPPLWPLMKFERVPSIQYLMKIIFD